MKQLKDYLHLYLGCECEYIDKLVLGNSEKRVAKSYGIDDKYVKLIPISFKGVLSSTMTFSRKISDVKPILRPLSDMTNDEWNEMGKPIRNGQNIRTAGDLWKMNAEETVYLLSHHFDLFGLIESGLAIDKTLTPTP